MQKIFRSTFFLIIFFSKSYAAEISQPISSGLFFTENNGQLKSGLNLPANEILYYSNSGSMGIYISKDKLYYVFTKSKNEKSFVDDKNEMPAEQGNTENFRVEIKLVNTFSNIEVSAEEETPFISNYFLPEFPKGISVRNFKKIKLTNVYPGINWILYFKEENGKSIFKYDFEVKNGADASQIKLQYYGATKISKSVDGGIEIETPFGKIKDGKPISFLSESKEKVKSSFLLNNNQISFEVKNTSTENLIIDPTVLWSTYFGYNGDEHGRAITAGVDGFLYAGGFTNSTNFPGLNGYNSQVHAAFDAWVMKLSPSLQPIWITYYGGSLADVCRTLDVDSAGNVFAGFETRSADIPTFNAYQTIKGDTDDFFITKLDPSGIPIWASFYGGNNLDGMRRIKLSHAGYLVASGYSMSTNFPMINPIQATNGGSADAVIMKLSMNTGFPIFTTYYGGSGYDEPVGITLDNNNNIFVVGTTQSTNFPVSNSYQSTLKGVSDIFVVKLNANLSVAWSTYIGSTDEDDGNGIAVDNSGSCFIVGTSLKGNYPRLNAWQNTIKLSSDAVISKLSSTGSLQWSTFAGGVGVEEGQAIAVDNSGNVLVTGYTLSPSFPLVNATQTIFGGQRDAFILRFTNNGICLLSTYYGGTGREQARSIAIDNNGSAYVIGSTGSTDLPVLNAFQSSPGGGNGDGDCFIMKINYSLAAKPIITVTGNNPKCNSSDFVTLTSSNTTGNIWSNGATTNNISVQQSGAYTVKTFDSTGAAISSDTIFIQNSLLNNYTADSLAYSNLCLSSNFDLIAPVVNGANYNWIGPNGFSSSIANPTLLNLQNASLGIYYCTVTLVNCSKILRKVNLVSYFNQLIPTNAIYSGPVCQGGQFTLQVDSFPVVQFIWSGPNGFSSSNRTVTVSNAQSTNAGTYSVKWILNGCQSALSTVTVVIYSAPVSDAGQDLLACNGNNSINLDGTVPVIGAGTWTAVGLPHPAIISLNDAHSLVTGLGATTYQFKWTVANGNCSPVTDIAIVKYTTAANYGCIKPSNLYHTINGNNASLSWSNCTIADQFQVSYTSNNISHLVTTTNYSTVLNNLPGGTYTWKVRPKCNGVWSAYSSIKTFTIVGPREEMTTGDAETSMQLFPNPVTDLLNVSFSISTAGNYKLEVYDLLGREIIAKENNYETGEWSEQLFTGQLSSGIYFVRLNGKDGMIETKKFVKN
ncbi:MAG: SBBP repeat-containing protein [Bacteroidota bacterium]